MNLITLYVDGKAVKAWHLVYMLGLVNAEQFNYKQIALEYKVMECKMEAVTLIHNRDYEMYVTVRSKLDPMKIPDNEYRDFINDIVDKCLKKVK